ncbi:MAG TPA: hypothetical protein VFZ66_29595 [Herpetosiphonaceae bacterium]
MPAWATAIQIAEESRWGKAPWEIMAQPGALRWIARRTVYLEERERARENKNT